MDDGVHLQKGEVCGAEIGVDANFGEKEENGNLKEERTGSLRFEKKVTGDESEDVLSIFLRINL